jgi:hypothetical protein
MCGLFADHFSIKRLDSTVVAIKTNSIPAPDKGMRISSVKGTGRKNFDLEPKGPSFFYYNILNGADLERAAKGVNTFFYDLRPNKEDGNEHDQHQSRDCQDHSNPALLATSLSSIQPIFRKVITRRGTLDPIAHELTHGDTNQPSLL